MSQITQIDGYLHLFIIYIHTYIYIAKNHRYLSFIIPYVPIYRLLSKLPIPTNALNSNFPYRINPPEGRNKFRTIRATRVLK